MTTAEELVVAMRAEGAQKTKEDIDDVGDSMGGVSDEAETQADEAADLSKRWSGAMTAIVTGLAAGSAFLLSKVPVVGEAMSGLGAIIDALAFQMDGVLRPILTPIGDLFFWISNKIYEAEGAWGTLIGVVATVISVLAIVIPAIAAVGAQIGVWTSMSAGLIAILQAVGGAVLTVIGAIGAVPLAIGLAIAALALLAWHFREEIVGAVLDAGDALTDFVSLVGEWSLNIIRKFLSGVGGLSSKVVGKFLDLTSTLMGWASGIAEAAYGWGKNLVQRFLDGIKGFANKVITTIGGGLNKIIETVNKAINQLPDKMKSKLGVSTVGTINTDSFTMDTSGSNGDSGGGGGSGTTLRRQTNGRGRIAMDGRKLDESTGLYSRDRTARRGI